MNTYFVSRVTAESGLKVALSGLGADELFGGYSTFRDIPALARRLRPLRFARRSRLLRWVSRAAAARMGNPKYAGVLEYGADHAGGYLLRRGLFMPWELPEILDPDLAREGWNRLDVLTRVERTLDSVKDPPAQISALELSWYMRNQLLRDADWAGMAHSLEIRVPFVDVDLLDAVMALRRAGTPPGKRDMAATPSKPVPRPVLERPKTGFGIPVREWLLDHDAADARERGLRGWAKTVYAAKTARVTH